MQKPGIITYFMKRTAEPACSLDGPWSEFSKAWKKTRQQASEKSVHDLRVNTRRMIENLQLARELTRQKNLGKLQRRFKKFLKEMSGLRDLQVQLSTVSHLPRSQALLDFTRRLERRGRRSLAPASFRSCLRR